MDLSEKHIQVLNSNPYPLHSVKRDPRFAGGPVALELNGDIYMAKKKIVERKNPWT